MEEPVIQKENIDTIYENSYFGLYDLRYAPQRHYYEVTRRKKDNLLAAKSDEEFVDAVADAVTIIPIVSGEGAEDSLLLFYEYRYPAGRRLLSVPAGLIDAKDLQTDNPLISAAKRELSEETGIPSDCESKFTVINRMILSSPGMTDESNAIVLCLIKPKSTLRFNNEGNEETERIDGFRLISKQEARKLIQNGCDERGIYYSAYTWQALLYFVSDLWK